MQTPGTLLSQSGNVPSEGTAVGAWIRAKRHNSVCLARSRRRPDADVLGPEADSDSLGTAL